MPHDEEQSGRNGPEEGKLRVAAGHAVALATGRHERRPIFLNDSLERKVDGFAPQLAGEHEHHFGFSGGPDEGHVDDAEGLGDEGQEGADEGYRVGGVLVTRDMLVTGEKSQRK